MCTLLYVSYNSTKQNSFNITDSFLNLIFTSTYTLNIFIWTLTGNSQSVLTTKLLILPNTSEIFSYNSILYPEKENSSISLVLQAKNKKQKKKHWSLSLKYCIQLTPHYFLCKYSDLSHSHLQGSQLLSLTFCCSYSYRVHSCFSTDICQSDEWMKMPFAS